MVAWLEDEKKLSANGRRTAMLDRIIAALAARAPAEPVAPAGSGEREADFEAPHYAVMVPLTDAEIVHHLRARAPHAVTSLDAGLLMEAATRIESRPPSAPEEREGAAATHNPGEESH